MTGLTRQQHTVVRFIGAYIAEHGNSPSYDEVAAGTNLKSKGRVCDIISDLEERGAVERIPGKARTVALKDPALGGGIVVNPVPEVRAAIEAYAREHRITTKTAAEEALRAYFMEPRGQ